MWTFKEAQEYLNNTAPPGKSAYGLGRINHLLDLLGHPERNFRCVTIVGTNGKGSVLAFLDSLLIAHGIKTACHVKPHLESVTERLRANGMDSSEDEFTRCLWEVRRAVNIGWTRHDRPTYFEILFAASLIHARNNRVDIALLEAGLGGRLDAVNAIDADMVILTSVGFDHTELLGDTLQKITMEKIVVLRPNSTLVCQVNPDEVMEVVRDYVQKNNCKLSLADGVAYQKDKKKSTDSFVYYSDRLGETDDIHPGLKGSYQAQNAELALLAFENIMKHYRLTRFQITPSAGSIRTGIAKARLPGRWETFKVGINGIQVILDGAHNQAGLDLAFREFIDLVRDNGVIVFGMKLTKNFQEVMPSLFKTAKRVIFVPVPDLKAYDPHVLYTISYKYLDNEGLLSQIEIDWTDTIIDGIYRAKASLKNGGHILVTGSLYLVGKVREMIMTGLIR